MADKLGLGQSSQKGHGWSTVGGKSTWAPNMLQGTVPSLPEMCRAALGVLIAGESGELSWNSTPLPGEKRLTVPSDVCTYLFLHMHMEHASHGEAK